MPSASFMSKIRGQLRIASRRGEKCPACRGRRVIWLARGSVPPARGVVVDEVRVDCPTCQGQGSYTPAREEEHNAND